MAEGISLSTVRQVLVVIFKYHGDVLLSTPVFSALREAMPWAHIDAYVYLDTVPMLLGHPAIREIFVYDKAWKSWKTWARIKREAVALKGIRDRNYDLVINLTKGDRGAVAAKVSKAPYCVGYHPDGGMLGQSRCFTHLVHWTPTKKHIVERNLDALRTIGIHPSSLSRDLFFAIPQEAREGVQEWMETEGIVSGHFILIHPSSRVHYKHWLPERFAQLISVLLRRSYQVVLSGGGSIEEREFADKILECLGQENKQVHDAVGQTSLKELGALIDNSKVLITVDSVPLHIASALKARTVVLFGPSCDITWGPWRNPYASVVAMHWPCRACDQEGCAHSWISDCLQEMPVAKVLEAVNEQLSLTEQNSLLDSVLSRESS